MPRIDHGKLRYTTERQILTVFEEALMIETVKYQQPSKFKGRTPKKFPKWNAKVADAVLDKFDGRKQKWVDDQLQKMFLGFDFSSLNSINNGLISLIRDRSYPIICGHAHLSYYLYGINYCHIGSWHKRYSSRMQSMNFYEIGAYRYDEYCKRIAKARKQKDRVAYTL